MGTRMEVEFFPPAPGENGYPAAKAAFYTVGVVLNLLVALMQLRRSRSTEGILTSTLIINILDFFVCLLAIWEAGAVDMNIYFIAFAICYTIGSRAILWSLMAMKVYMHFFTCLYCFIKFLFPFMRIERHSMGLVTTMILTLPGSGILAFIPHLFKATYDLGARQCMITPDFHASPDTIILLRMQVLFGLLYCYFLPSFFSMYMYQKILRAIQERGGRKSNLALKEIRNNYILDVWLNFITALPVRLITFYSLYGNNSLGSKRRTIVTFTVIPMQSYAVVYPVLCILFKRRLYRPIIEVFIRLGWTLGRKSDTGRVSKADSIRKRMSFTDRSSVLTSTGRFSLT
ncbi:unnamed protein product [Calicophoron daubneyi]|uniref:G-protein coupled receptors family 1 profile domain-containing protein n=1 Tax=Calicophoron daubneyi TaxID=300641 RepID=A0AAV2TBM9_CALDB